jgi:CRP-like cAMP-binding protein
VSLANEAEMIRQAPIFNSIPPGLRKLLCFSSDHLSYQVGQVMFHEGEASDAAYLVMEGTVEITIGTPQGPRLVARLGRNDILGETGILGDVARTGTAIAASRVEALRITKDLFCNIVRECPEVALQLGQVLAQRLANTTAQLGVRGWPTGDPALLT